MNLKRNWDNISIQWPVKMFDSSYFLSWNTDGKILNHSCVLVNDDIMIGLNPWSLKRSKIPIHHNCMEESHKDITKFPPLCFSEESISLGSEMTWVWVKETEFFSLMSKGNLKILSSFILTYVIKNRLNHKRSYFEKVSQFFVHTIE